MEEKKDKRGNPDLHKYSRKRRETVLRRKEIVTYIIEQLAQQVSTYLIIGEVVNKFGCSRGMATRYCTKAYKIIEETTKETRERALSKQITALEEQVLAARKDKDRRLVLDITREINKIKGLYETKVDVTSGGKPLEGIKINYIIPKTDNAEEDKTNE